MDRGSQGYVYVSEFSMVRGPLRLSSSLWNDSQTGDGALQLKGLGAELPLEFASQGSSSSSSSSFAFQNSSLPPLSLLWVPWWSDLFSAAWFTLCGGGVNHQCKRQTQLDVC